MKKWMAVLMAVAMILAMAVPAMADDTTGTITISNAVTGHEYKAYKLLDLSYESHGTETETDDGYVYYLPLNTSGWYDFLTSDEVSGENGYITVDPESGIVTWKTGADENEFAELALAYAEDEDNELEPDASATASSAVVELATSSFGYYLVESGVGALVVLTSATPDVTITEKNAAPTMEKKVKEVSEDGKTTTWVEFNRVEAGEEIEYRVTINVADGASNYVLYDLMDTDHISNETMEDSIEIYLNDNGSKDLNKIVNKDNYTFVLAETGVTDYTFKIIFDNDYLADLAAGAVLTVYYSAYMAGTEEAVTSAPHMNTAWLTYGDDGMTAKSIVKTASYGLEVLKYGNNDMDIRLGGAKFELYRDYNAETGKYDGLVKVHEVEDDSDITIYTVCNVEHDDDDASITTLITPDESGTFIVYGLDTETYYLVETEAPAGYNPLDTHKTVTLDVEQMTTKRIYDVNINNNTGIKLPSTGGVGTTVFYALGGLLVVGAAVLLITKKRMGTEK